MSTNLHKHIQTMINKQQVRRTLAEEYGQWLDELVLPWSWDYFITVTAPAGENRTAGAWRRTMNRICKARYDSYFHSHFFWALERHKSGQLHAHALLRLWHMGSYGSLNDDMTNPRDHIRNMIFAKCILTGRSQVMSFDPKLAATHYVSKYVVKEADGVDWDFVNHYDIRNREDWEDDKGPIR